MCRSSACSPRGAAGGGSQHGPFSATSTCYFLIENAVCSPQSLEMSRGLKPEAVTQVPVAEWDCASCEPRVRARGPSLPFPFAVWLRPQGRLTPHPTGTSVPATESPHARLAHPGCWGGTVAASCSGKGNLIMEKTSQPASLWQTGQGSPSLSDMPCLSQRGGPQTLSRPLHVKDAFSCQEVFLAVKQLLAFQSQEHGLWPSARGSMSPPSRPATSHATDFVRRTDCIRCLFRG